MTATPSVTPPSPQLFFEVISHFQDTAVLKTAIELDVFTAVAEGNQTPAALAKRCQCAERGMRILCDALVALGFLKKSGENYAVTQDSAIFLNRNSPAYVGAAVTFLAGAPQRQAFDLLTEAVRKGGTAQGGDGSVKPENPMWVDFARGMAPLMQYPAEKIAELLDAKAGKPWKVLDVAAGHGIFGVTLARINPQAQITALDWRNVLEVAKENAERAGVAARHRLLPGSAFEVDFGKDFDVVLMTNFLHHFDVPTCEKLLRKVHAALAPGGRIVILEFVPDTDRVSPPVPAKFSITMLVNTPGGEAYTFAEYERMLSATGFRSASLHPLGPSPQQIVLAEK